MEKFQKKELQTSRGFTYTYYVYTPPTESVSTCPTLLLQHGWPDDAHLWQFVVAKLPRYRIVAPDLLGYAGTSKPTDPAAYNASLIAKDETEILDAEGIDKVISVGHDWGSYQAQRLYLYHAERVASIVILNVAYMPPSPEPFDLEKALVQTEAAFGRPLQAYWEFFTADDGPGLMRERVDRVWSAMHGAPQDWMARMFCVRGGFRDWVTDPDKGDVELRPYAQSPQLRDTFLERMRRDGFDGPQCWYHAYRSNIQHAAEKNIPAGNLKVKVPMLYITCTEDAVCLPEIMEAPRKLGLLPDEYEQVQLECGHWSPFEKPAEIAEAMDTFLKRNFAS